MRINEQAIIDAVRSIIEKAEFADVCCDKPEDRMYHAEDKTWWRRVGNAWCVAEPPEGWRKV